MILCTHCREAHGFSDTYSPKQHYLMHQQTSKINRKGLHSQVRKKYTIYSSKRCIKVSYTPIVVLSQNAIASKHFYRHERFSSCVAVVEPCDVHLPFFASFRPSGELNGREAPSF